MMIKPDHVNVNIKNDIKQAIKISILWRYQITYRVGIYFDVVLVYNVGRY